EGTLTALGRAADRIVFTSANDNEFGVTNLPNKTLPTKNAWKGIEFAGPGAQLSQLEHCIIRYSDQIISARFSKPSLRRIIVADCGTSKFVVNGKAVLVEEGIEHDYDDPADSNIPASNAANGDGSASPPTLSSQPDELSFGEMTTGITAKTADRIEPATEAIRGDVVAALIVKLIALEKNAGSAGAELTIYVMGAPNVAAELQKAVGKTVGSTTLKNVLEGEELPKAKPTALYVGNELRLEEAIRYCRANRVLSIAGDDKLSPKGVTLGIGVGNDGKPKITLNLSASSAEGLYWNPMITKFAKTIN
ncbi:MAG: YfiR/HmsC family protein, partial [bacterium]